jgi:protein involved in polysaccharide export with SLBB domain
MRIALPCIAVLSALTTLAQNQLLPTPQPNAIVVDGSVKRPGVFPVSGASRGESVLKVISRAGGLSHDADLIAFIIRTDKDGLTHTISVPLRDILRGVRPDIETQAGDILFVPDRSHNRLKHNLPNIDPLPPVTARPV